MNNENALYHHNVTKNCSTRAWAIVQVHQATMGNELMQTTHTEITLVFTSFANSYQSAFPFPLFKSYGPDFKTYLPQERI